MYSFVTRTSEAVKGSQTVTTETIRGVPLFFVRKEKHRSEKSQPTCDATFGIWTRDTHWPFVEDDHLQKLHTKNFFTGPPSGKNQTQNNFQ